MKPPPHYKLNRLHPGQVLQLNSMIYGLKQSGHRWYEVLCNILINFELIRLETDHAVFHRTEEDGLITILFVHVNDMTLIARNIMLMKCIKVQIASRVKVEDNGPLHWFLGIEIWCNCQDHTIAFLQKAYIVLSSKSMGFLTSNHFAMPADTHVQLSTKQSPKTSQEINTMKNKPYAKAIGSLNYASITTRPDITYAVSQVAHYNSNPGTTHWTAVKHIFQEHIVLQVRTLETLLPKT